MNHLKPLFAKKKRGNLRKIKPLIFWSFRAFKARVLGSSPSQLTKGVYVTTA